MFNRLLDRFEVPTATAAVDSEDTRPVEQIVGISIEDIARKDVDRKKLTCPATNCALSVICTAETKEELYNRSTGEINIRDWEHTAITYTCRRGCKKPEAAEEAAENLIDLVDISAEINAGMH